MIHFPQDLESKYRFVTLAAQRCDQLIRGAKPRVESEARKPTTLALQEVMAGVVETRGPDDVEDTEMAPLPETPAITPGVTPGVAPGVAIEPGLEAPQPKPETSPAVEVAGAGAEPTGLLAE